MKFGEKIKWLRQERGWNQLDLADHTKLTNATISRYENGKIIDVPSAVLQEMSDVFDVSSFWLWDDEQGLPPVRRNTQMKQINVTEEAYDLLIAWARAEDWQKEAVKKLLNM